MADMSAFSRFVFIDLNVCNSSVLLLIFVPLDVANDDQEIMIIIFLVTLLKIMNKDCKFLKETVVLCR